VLTGISEGSFVIKRTSLNPGIVILWIIALMLRAREKAPA